MTFVAGNGNASLISQAPRSIQLHAEVDSPEATIALRRFYFPGWKAEAEAMVIEPRKGLLTVRLPHGIHEVSLRQPWFDGERIGTIISLCSLITLIGWMMVSRHNKKSIRI